MNHAVNQVELPFASGLLSQQSICGNSGAIRLKGLTSYLVQPI